MGRRHYQTSEQLEAEFLPFLDTGNTSAAVASSSIKVNDVNSSTLLIPPCLTPRKKKIDATVLTSEEYLNEIEKKATDKKSYKKNKKDPKKNTKVIESDSESDEELCNLELDDESDIENITLQDIVNEEDDWSDTENSIANETLQIKQGDYVSIIIRFVNSFGSPAIDWGGSFKSFPVEELGGLQLVGGLPNRSRPPWIIQKELYQI
ncbi:hypothetical protein FQA39_LY14552 [Lamprigera yunnana]|nr:hypothetical protein FQA39_LY14552 [Lamprigera yunnana]